MSNDDTNPLLEWDNIVWREPNGDRSHDQVDDRAPSRDVVREQGQTRERTDDATAGFLDRIRDRGPSRDWAGHDSDRRSSRDYPGITRGRER